MALIIITVELSIDSLHTIVGNPKKQYITKKTGTCFWRAHLQSLGGRFSRKSMWAELLILIRTSVTHSLLVKESIYITSITPA